MQAVVDIKFNELLKIIKSLPESKLSELKMALEDRTQEQTDRETFGSLLLNGPTFSDEQISDITKARQAIDQLRTK